MHEEEEDWQEPHSDFAFDFRTGRPTAISSAETGQPRREACAAINSDRTRAILSAAQKAASRKSVPIDAWTATFARGLDARDIPLIPLADLNIHADDDGFLESETLQELTPGAEAKPYFDPENAVVYKLFYLREHGHLGKKLLLAKNAEGSFEVELTDADLIHTLTKIAVLNLAGGHPTEIVGLAADGEHLVAKQPLAQPRFTFLSDQKEAISHMRGIIPQQGGFRQNVVIIWADDKPWLVGDLHERNVMRGSDGQPTIIDALIGEIPDAAIRELPWLQKAIADAKHFRTTGQAPSNDLFAGVHDDEL